MRRMKIIAPLYYFFMVSQSYPCMGKSEGGKRGPLEEENGIMFMPKAMDLVVRDSRPNLADIESFVVPGEEKLKHRSVGWPHFQVNAKMWQTSDS